MLYFIIVIYNQKINLEKYNCNQKIIFCDNSTNLEIKSFNSELFANQDNMHYLYIDMGGNVGLSKAYNRAISTLHLVSSDYVVFLDQDTEVNKCFFEKYVHFISSHGNLDVICPIVMDSVGVLSPCEKKRKKYHHITGLENIDYTDLSKYSFINSGMCIKADVFHKISYDECLFLDFVDHDFVLSVFESGYKVGICPDIILQQNFSGVTKNTFNSDKNRFMIYCKDASYFYKKRYKKSALGTVFLRALKLTYLHKNFFFITYLLKNGIYS